MKSQVTSTLIGCQVFGRHMLNQRKGSIINISSASAGPPLSKAFTYSIAKAGILNLTQNLGREWGTKGVRVNAIRPGFFPTEWNRKNFITKDREAAILAHTPMARFGKVDELTMSTDHIAIPFTTGENVKVIDGPFNGFNGTIEKVNEEKRKLEVMVKIFGRKTPLELSYMQVEKL